MTYSTRGRSPLRDFPSSFSTSTTSTSAYALPPQFTLTNPITTTTSSSSIHTPPIHHPMIPDLNQDLDRLDRDRPPPPRSREHDQWISERHNRERPSRTLFIRNIDFHCQDRELEDHFRTYGPLRDFFSMSSRRGIAFVTYFDLRDSQRAKEELNGSMVCGRNIDVHYSLPREDVTPDTKCDHTKNQGTLFVVFEDPSIAQRVSDEEFRSFLEDKFGQVHAMDRLRGNPAQRFIEFFDSRACVQAQRGIDRSNFRGSPMVAEFSWDKATKEAIQLGTGNRERDRFPRGRGRSRSRSPGSRFRREDANRFGRPRSRSPRGHPGIRYPDGQSPRPNTNSPHNSINAPVASSLSSVMSAEQVQRMLLAAAGGGSASTGTVHSTSSAQPPHNGYGPNTNNVSNSLLGALSSLAAPSTIPNFNSAAMGNSTIPSSLNTGAVNNNISSQLAALSALLPSLNNMQQQHQQQQPQFQLPGTGSHLPNLSMSSSSNSPTASATTTNPAWAALAQIVSAATNNQVNNNAPLAQFSSLLSGASSNLSSTNSSVGNGQHSHIGGHAPPPSTHPYHQQQQQQHHHQQQQHIGNGMPGMSTGSSSTTGYLSGIGGILSSSQATSAASMLTTSGSNVNSSLSSNPTSSSSSNTASTTNTSTGYEAYASLLQQMRVQSEGNQKIHQTLQHQQQQPSSSSSSRSSVNNDPRLNMNQKPQSE